MAAREGNHQGKIIESMQRPDFYPHPVKSVELRETHISLVFLTGEFVYKIKKPAAADSLDIGSDFQPPRLPLKRLLK